jgi:phosphonate transport system substrate-binding protein
MRTLRLTSSQAPNASHIPRGLAGYLGTRLGMPVTFADDLSWQEREAQLAGGAIQIGWLCGLAYVRWADVPEPTVELLAAHVMAGTRYGGEPVYFSDVVVRRESAFRSFADLRGAAWAYNEPASHSGYEVVRYHLATLGERAGYFGRAVEAGSHQNALKLILEGQVDGAAVDSTVLEEEFRRSPALAGQIRVVETLGPSPIPPWVIHRSVPPGQREAIRAALLSMHDDPAGQVTLAEGHLARFVQVSGHDYDPIREMARLAAPVRLASDASP